MYIKRAFISLMLLSFLLTNVACTTVQPPKSRVLTKKQILQKMFQALQKKQEYHLTYDKLINEFPENTKLGKVTKTKQNYKLQYQNPERFQLEIKEEIDSSAYQRKMSFNKKYNITEQQVFEDGKPTENTNLTEYITRKYLQTAPLLIHSHPFLQHIKNQNTQIRLENSKTNYILYFASDQPQIIKQMLQLEKLPEPKSKINIRIYISKTTFLLSEIKSIGNYQLVEPTQKKIFTFATYWKFS